ncbi:MAG: Hpt domain-containing protein, partial [Bacillota bacterium]
LLSCPDSIEQFGRIRLGENGEFLLSPAAKPLPPEEQSHALDELYRLLRQLKAIARDDRFSSIEETAHRVRETAHRLGASELAELAFKAELSARKGKWQDAAEYCVMMVNEIDFRFKEG